MRLKTGLVVVLVAVSTVVGGVALAASNDTLLIEGFDPDNNVLVFGVSDIDEDSLDCTVEGAGCDLTEVDVTGPAGQVNHGQVVSSFVHALKEQLKAAGMRGGIGCLVRIVAQSDYGKGDQQQGPTVADSTAVVSGEFDLSAHEATCHGKKVDETETDADNDDANSNGNGGNGNNGNGNNGNGNSGNGNGNGNSGNRNGNGNGNGKDK